MPRDPLRRFRGLGAGVVERVGRLVLLLFLGAFVVLSDKSSLDSYTYSWKATAFSLGVASPTTSRLGTGTRQAPPNNGGDTHCSLRNPCSTTARLYHAVRSPVLRAKKKGGGGGSSKKSGTGGTLRGFGGPTAVSSSSGGGSNTPATMDRSPPTRRFADFLDQYRGAEANLRRTALAHFPIATPSAPEDGNDPPPTMRGVVALKDFAKGDDIISIPYELAVDLGRQGDDPTLPALALLRDYCHMMSPHGSSPHAPPPAASNSNRASYFALLPPFGGSECKGSTDFFSDEALGALQAPWVVRETLQRRELVRLRFSEAAAATASQSPPLPSWIDGSPLTEDHLRWAVWLITSRVLTVQGDGGAYHRVLIPYLDMCNHRRSSTHVLTGRAVPGGSLKVVAGSAVKAGEQVYICYGGGVAGNDRFLQDYGFLDTESPEGFGLVTKQLVGTRYARAQGSAAASSFLHSDADRREALQALDATSLEQDEVDLLRLRHCTPPTDPALLAALEFRIGVKKSLRDTSADLLQ